MMICVFAASFLVLEDFSSFLCVDDESASPPDSLQRAGALVDWHRLRATDVEDAEGGEEGAGGEDKEVGMWQGEWGKESKDMTQDEPKTLTFCHTWATWNVRSMCCGACTRKVCVCVATGLA